jgi:hypothetical protein
VKCAGLGKVKQLWQRLYLVEGWKNFDEQHDSWLATDKFCFTNAEGETSISAEVDAELALVDAVTLEEMPVVGEMQQADAEAREVPLVVGDRVACEREGGWACCRVVQVDNPQTLRAQR